MSFVGIKQLSSEEELKAEEKLKDFLNNRKAGSCCYFLRWNHAVSGIIRELKDLPGKFPSPEGQMFNGDWEVRWKQNKKGYEVLLLSTTQENGFAAVGNEWETEIRQAHVYSNSETRFPRKFKVEFPNITQRYFIEKETSTVQFIALTVEDKNDKLTAE